MKYLDLTLATPAENLAFDEALLLDVDQLGTPPDRDFDVNGRCQVLRFWRATTPCVIVGRSSRVDDEVHVDRAVKDGIPILRRISGGATVVIAPGCLMYSLRIHLDAAPGLRLLDVAHRYVMHHMLAAIQTLSPTAELDGTCDLVHEDRKFSGNSLRVGRNWMLYHGTVLLNMELSLIDYLLKHPPREPEYRRGRSHSEFVTNLGVQEEEFIHSACHQWKAFDEMQNPPANRVPQLLAERYARDDWNFQR